VHTSFTDGTMLSVRNPASGFALSVLCARKNDFLVRCNVVAMRMRNESESLCVHGSSHRS